MATKSTKSTKKEQPKSVKVTAKPSGSGFGGYSGYGVSILPGESCLVPVKQWEKISQCLWIKKALRDGLLAIG